MPIEDALWVITRFAMAICGGVFLGIAWGLLLLAASGGLDEPAPPATSIRRPLTTTTLILIGEQP